MTRLGRGIDRIEARLKVTGEAVYTADIPLETLAYGALVGSTVARGRIRKLDTRAAERVPGVLRIFTHQNTRYPGEMVPATMKEMRLGLIDDRVNYVGEIIAVVVADSLLQAEEAAALVRAEYDEEVPITTFERGLPDAFRPRVGSGYVEVEPDNARGDFAAAFEAAPVRFEAEYGTPKMHQTPIETYSTTAMWESEQLVLFDSTQYVVGIQTGVAGALGVPPDNVRVVSNYVGGGFGAKGNVWPHIVLAALAARQLRRPVKVQLTRPQMQTYSPYQARTRQTVRLGATETGDVRAAAHAALTQSGLDDRLEEVPNITRLLYAFPNVATSERLVRTNHPTSGFMRTPTEGPGMFGLECALDELAYELGMDPIELRRRNYAERDPQENLPFSGNALLACYAQGAERIGWAERDPTPRSMRDGHDLIGYGMASTARPHQTIEASAAVTLRDDGGALVATGVAEIGGGSYTTLVQIAADDLGMPYEQVGIRGGDSTLPAAAPTFASFTSGSTGSAVKLAAQDARRQAARLAVANPNSPLYGAAVEDIVPQDGRLVRRDDPGRGESYRAILEREGLGTLRGEGTFVPGEGGQLANYTFGAQFAEVRVDELLGTVRVSRFVGAFGLGRILNLKTATSQARGGIIYGIGAALMEEVHHDHASGRLINANLFDYHIPVSADIPVSDIEVVFIDDGDREVNPLGVKGLGEVVTTGVTAAVANAVFHATGRRVRELPLTPHKLI